MESDRILRVKELFLLAVDLDPAGRRSCLDRHSGGDVELRARVERLLRHADGGLEDGLIPPGVRDERQSGGAEG